MHATTINTIATQYPDPEAGVDWEAVEAADLGCTVEELRELKAWEAARDAEMPTMRADYAEMADAGVWF
jgi:hypothetical protein